MNFDSTLTDTQVARYDFVGFALDNKLHDLFLAWRQFLDPPFYFFSFEHCIAVFLVVFERLVNPIK